MRVNLLFNTLCAPLLYNSIYIRADTIHHPLAIPERQGRARRLSTKKTYNLKYVEYITADTHTVEWCKGHLSRISDLSCLIKNARCLRINTRHRVLPKRPVVHQNVNETSRHCALYGAKASHPRCPVALQFTGDKIVIFGNGIFSTPFDYCLPRNKVPIIVGVVTPDSATLNLDVGADLGDQNIKTCILVLWRPRPRHFAKGLGSFTTLDLSIFGNSVRQSLRGNHKRNILIVNAGPTGSTLIRERMESPRRVPVNLDGLQFLTMEEYLTKHDWTGVFTPEEAQPWLDDPADLDWPEKPASR